MTPAIPQLPHEAFDCAPGDVAPVATQPQPELAGAEHLPLLLPRGQEDRLPPLIRHRGVTGRGLARRSRSMG